MMKSLVCALILTLSFIDTGFARCPPVCGQGLNRGGGSRLDQRLREHREDLNERRQERQRQRQQQQRQRPVRHHPSAGALHAEAQNLFRAGRVDAAIATLRQAFKYVRKGSRRHMQLEGDWYIYWAAKYRNAGNYPAAIRAVEKSIRDIGGARGQGVAVLYAVTGQTNLYNARVRWLRQLKREYAKKGHEIKQCLKDCTSDHRSCMALAKTPEGKRFCTRRYGRCREKCAR
jgi:tetratricopeptide (TPR) repeat protein